MGKYAKALVPVIVGLIVVALGKLGVTPDTSVKDLVTLLVTGGLVWLVPNKG